MLFDFKVIDIIISFIKDHSPRIFFDIVIIVAVIIYFFKSRSREDKWL